MDGKEYLACWDDIVKLYNTDKKDSIRLTKLTFTSVYPKPLQRQSVPLVCKVFNEKTVAGLRACQSQLNVQEGTIKFTELITQWFTMMNVKDRYASIRLQDKYRSSWTLNCENFVSLQRICDVIDSCRWAGGKIRQKKLTAYTANAFTITTKNIINAAKYLLQIHNFEYVLPSVFSQDPLEKFFGQARQRFGGNFYIDVKDVLVAGKVQRLHQMVKYDAISKDNNSDPFAPQCSSCEDEPSEEDIDLVESLQICNTKVVFIAGYLVHKYGATDSSDDYISSVFLEELNRGGLCVPTLDIAFFVHNAFHLFENLCEPRKYCGKYVAKLLEMVNSSMAKNKRACQSLKNILFKAYVLNCSDRENELGCLRRQEKL